jgi:hypothetical protein
VKLLDTPQWAALNTAQKAIVTSIYSNDTGKGWTVILSPRSAKTAQELAARGLVTITDTEPGETTLTLREDGWSQEASL